MTIADKLREIAALTRRINDAQHAGLKVTAEDWSDLYAATTNLEAIADDLDKPVTIGIHVSEGIVAGVSASIPNFEYFVADEDVFEGSCAGGIDGQCAPHELEHEREWHEEARELLNKYEALPYSD
jgi:hypothetical protein